MTIIHSHRGFTGLLVFFAGLLLLAGCSTTQLTSQWYDVQHVRKIDSVLVISVTDDAHRRRIHEDSFTEAMEDHGLTAKQGYRVLGDTEPDPQVILDRVQGEPVDALLVTHLIGVDNEQVFHPPRVSAVPNRYYDHFTGYYRTVYTYVHVPDYISEHVIVRLETNLYDAASQALLWSAQSESTDPESAEKLVVELARKVTASLQNAGFIN